MSMECRTTVVGNLLVDIVKFSSVIQLGDNRYTQLNSREIAVQKSIPIFSGNENPFASYPIFFRPAINLHPRRDVLFQSHSSATFLTVGSVKINYILAASLLRTGCGGPHKAESRILNIRQYNNSDIR
jgi:spore germination protein PE